MFLHFTHNFLYLLRLKDVAQKQYSHKEAEMGAGKTLEVLPPAHGPNTTTVEMATNEDNDSGDDDSMDEDDSEDDA